MRILASVSLCRPPLRSSQVSPSASSRLSTMLADAYLAKHQVWPSSDKNRPSPCATAKRRQPNIETPIKMLHCHGLFDARYPYHLECLFGSIRYNWQMVSDGAGAGDHTTNIHKFLGRHPQVEFCFSTLSPSLGPIKGPEGEGGD